MGGRLWGEVLRNDVIYEQHLTAPKKCIPLLAGGWWMVWYPSPGQGGYVNDGSYWAIFTNIPPPARMSGNLVLTLPGWSILTITTSLIITLFFISDSVGDNIILPWPETTKAVSRKIKHTTTIKQEC